MLETTENLKTQSELNMNELERQDSYTDALPAEYNYPLFSGKQAIESQRHSGYKSTARAAREIVDNAYEAGADNVWIIFDILGEKGRKKHQQKNTVTSVAFIDDGPGMRHVPGGKSMLRYALTWGGGSHWKSPEGIGKFGFGLPNSSINQTKRVEVYSKTKDSTDWFCATLDIHDVPVHGLVTIPEPEVSVLPEYVSNYLKRNNINLESGTIVVWDKPDRLSVTTRGSLRDHLQFDFNITYRGLLDKFNIFVEADKPLQTLDPLFLTPGALYYLPTEEGGAQCTFDKDLIVKYYRDSETGRQHLSLLQGEEEVNKAWEEEENPSEGETDVVVGVIKVRIARLPNGFAKGKGTARDSLEYKRFRVRKDRKGITFVRSGREIDTHDAFPKDKDEKVYGEWPLMQSYAYHYGIDLLFNPDLDQAFGIGNDKQTATPIEDVFKVLHDAKVDEALRLENQWQHKQRQKTKKNKIENDIESIAPALTAAQQADSIIGKARKISEESQKESKEIFDKTVQDEASKTNKPDEEIKEALIKEANRKKYDIEFIDAPGGVFMVPAYGNGLQIVVQINTAHSFFSLLSDIGLSLGVKARNAVVLLLIGFAKAELEAGTDEAKRTIKDMRENVLNRFLSNSLSILDSLMPEEEETEEQYS